MSRLRTGLFGNGQLIIVLPRLQLTELFSLVSIRSLEQKCSERQEHLVAASFVWLALHDRCWTAARRKRHNLQDNDTCGACLQLPETISHILIGCIYAREVWSTLFRRWHWLGLSAGLSDDREFYDWWNWSRKQVPGLNRRAFDTLVVLTFWMLWKERNNRIFQNSNLQASDLVLRIFDEAKSWAYVGFNQLQKLFPDALNLRSQNPAYVIV